MNRVRLLFWVSIFALVVVPWAPITAASSGFEGHWEGVFVFPQTGTEVDFVTDFTQSPDGSLVGLVGLPVSGLEDQPLLDVVAKERQISFEYHDDTGSSFLEGTLSPDGRRIEGTMREKEKILKFFLKRKPKPVPPPASALQQLSPDFRELRDAFNRDAGHVRVLVALSPKCSTCLAAARAVQRYVLDENPSDRLRFYVVWAPMLKDEDTVGAAQKALIHLTDPRVKQFWINDKTIAEAMGKPLQLPEQKAWDLFYLYSPKAQWTGGVPHPDDFLHALHKTLGEDRQFSGAKMDQRLRAMLSPQ
jgi:hypothetical protein